MRTMLKAHLDVRASNIAMSDGTIEKVLGEVFAECKPEAAYFCTESGRRTVYAIFDMRDPSMIPVLAEPFFQGLDAEVHFIPVMVQEDLAKGAAAWAAKRG